MLRHGERLTLSELDLRRWERISGLRPTGVRSMSALQAYVEKCKQRHAGFANDAAFIRWLIEIELERYGGEPAADRPVCLELVQEESQRDKLARELLWNIVLDGDVKRRAELEAWLHSQLTPGKAVQDIAPAERDPREM